MKPLMLGFTAWQDGTWELIVQDKNTYKEVTLTGKWQNDKELEKIREILPDCVFVKAEHGKA